MRRRLRFDSRAPITDEWSSLAAGREGREQRRISVANMREFDLQPAVVRAVEHVTGNIGVAKRLVAVGYADPASAEAVVRDMLERRWGTGKYAR